MCAENFCNRKCSDSFAHPYPKYMSCAMSPATHSRFPDKGISATISATQVQATHEEGTCCSSGRVSGAAKAGMTYWPRAGALYRKCCRYVVPKTPPPTAAGMLGMCSRPFPGASSDRLIACSSPQLTLMPCSCTCHGVASAAAATSLSYILTKRLPRSMQRPLDRLLITTRVALMLCSCTCYAVASTGAATSLSYILTQQLPRGAPAPA